MENKSWFWFLRPWYTRHMTTILEQPKILNCLFSFQGSQKQVYYMASSGSGQDKPNHSLWLATWAGKMELLYLARAGLPAVSRKKNFPESHIINPLLTKLFWSKLLDIGLALFPRLYDLDFVSVHKHAIKELGQYPAMLTSHLVNNPYVLLCRCIQCM